MPESVLNAFCSFFIGVCVVAPEVAWAQYSAPRQLAILENQKISESSGLASSRRRADIFWTHNDSGDTARIFAFDMQGAARGVVKVKKAQAVDWEDMASYSHDGTDYLILADVGDNQLQREEYVLYRIVEPRPEESKTRVHAVFRFRYEDGPQNCEAVAVDPETETVFLVGKRIALSCPIYRISLDRAGGLDGENAARRTAKRIGALNLPVATGMDISPDGRRAIVLTYGHAFEFSRRQGESWESAFAREPATVIMPARRQGEAICYSRDGRSLMLTSEQLPTPVWVVPSGTGE